MQFVDAEKVLVPFRDYGYGPAVCRGCEGRIQLGPSETKYVPHTVLDCLHVIQEQIREINSWRGVN